MYKAGLIILAGIALLGLATPTTVAANIENFVVHLTGDEEVPPTATLATGQAIFNVSPDGTAIEYRLIVANIENVVASHIHCCAPVGVNAGVVAFLHGPAAPGGGRTDGVLAQGTIT